MMSSSFMPVLQMRAATSWSYLWLNLLGLRVNDVPCANLEYSKDFYIEI